MLSRDFQRFLGRIDAGDDRARRSERLGEDSSPATDVERALAAEPSEHPAEVLHADDIQLVQARERPGATPPDVRRGLDQSLVFVGLGQTPDPGDRKSTRLNSSHLVISYAVFCLKKKKTKKK